MKRLLFSFLFVLTAIAGWAQEPTTFTQGDFTYTVTDDENHYVSIAKADEATFNSALVIPSSVVYETVTYAVTAVGYEGFIGTGITSVTIPASVLSVDSQAFYDCDGLIAITIEDSETALQWNGTDYHPLDQVNSNYTLYLGRDLTTEGNQCFFPGATSVEIGDRVTAVNPYLFDGANKLAFVTMGSGVTTIGGYAFQNTGTDESVMTQSITLGANVTTIGDYAFSGCNKLTTLDLGTKLTAIPENMLFSCSALTSITIPASVQSVGAHAFYDCDGLTAITIEDSETALQWNGTGYHPLDQVHANYTLYLGRDLTTEGNQCFFPGATSVEIGDQMTTVNPYLFDGANKLASVTMGSGVTTIGDYAFRNTGMDESVTAQSIALGANVITIGDYAFSGCNKLTTLALGRKLTAIPENMLFGCSALTGITIPASVQSVGSHAFYDCDGLTAITIEDSETALQWNGTDYHPLDQVNSNYTLYLGRDLTTEGEWCFFPGVTSVEFGPQVTAIPNNLFSGAELSSVKVPWLTPITINENVFASGAYSSAILSVPAGTKEAYAAASIWENFTNIDHWSTLVTLTASTHGSIVTAE
ncbi:MAG: leucine-rich repeat protein, partial [Prevotella sp.]|nr:leucine-rich repeat protein [Prevotella sp.]